MPEHNRPWPIPLLSQYSLYFQQQRACPDVGAFSVSVWQLPETIHSIKNQIEHYRTRTFQEEYLAFLKRHEHSTRCRLLMPGLSFDDKYLWD
jgi:hypothetical protein